MCIMVTVTADPNRQLTLCYSAFTRGPGRHRAPVMKKPWSLLRRSDLVNELSIATWANVSLLMSSQTCSILLRVKVGVAERVRGHAGIVACARWMPCCLLANTLGSCVTEADPEAFGLATDGTAASAAALADDDEQLEHLDLTAPPKYRCARDAGGHQRGGASRHHWDTDTGCPPCMHGSWAIPGEYCFKRHGTTAARTGACVAVCRTSPAALCLAGKPRRGPGCGQTSTLGRMRRTRAGAAAGRQCLGQRIRRTTGWR